MNVERNIMTTDSLGETIDASRVRRVDTPEETKRVEAARKTFEKIKKDNAPNRPEMFAESRIMREVALRPALEDEAAAPAAQDQNGAGGAVPDARLTAEPVAAVRQDGQNGSRNGYGTVEGWMEASAGNNAVNGRQVGNSATESGAMRELAVVGSAPEAVDEGKRGSLPGSFIRRLGGGDDSSGAGATTVTERGLSGNGREREEGGGTQPLATTEGDGITETPAPPVGSAPDEGPTPAAAAVARAAELAAVPEATPRIISPRRGSRA